MTSSIFSGGSAKDSARWNTPIPRWLFFPSPTQDAPVLQVDRWTIEPSFVSKSERVGTRMTADFTAVRRNILTPSSVGPEAVPGQKNTWVLRQATYSSKVSVEPKSM